jgi:hypothetical protein
VTQDLSLEDSSLGDAVYSSPSPSVEMYLHSLEAPYSMKHADSSTFTLMSMEAYYEDLYVSLRVIDHWIMA